MKSIDLNNKINQLKLEVFSMQDLQKLFPKDLNIKIQVKRLVDRGVLTRITRGLYKLPNTGLDLEKLSTQIYNPSYISFEGVLSKYGVINQGFYKITLATTRHSKKMELSGVPCEYTQIKDSLFFGFNLIKDTYIAEVEKAFLDEIYLMVLGKRVVNTDEWNVENLDKKKIKEYLKKFSKGVGNKALEILAK
jgi:predicted transcriptional regulator of viral defense system